MFLTYQLSMVGYRRETATHMMEHLTNRNREERGESEKRRRRCVVHVVYVVRYFVFLCVTCVSVCNSRSYLYTHMNMFFLMFFFFCV